MKRLLRLGLGLFAIALVLATVVVWWLLGSPTGRDLTLDRVLAALPEGALLIGEREGSLAGGLRLRDLVFEDASVRVEIDVLEATPRVPGWRSPTLNLSRLSARGVRVQLKPTPPSPMPTWPALLPTLDLPFAVRIEAVALRGVSLTPAEGNPIVVDALDAAVALSSGRLAVEALSVRGPEGEARGEVVYVPADDFATRLVLDAAAADGSTVALRAEGARARGTLTLKGAFKGEVEGDLALNTAWEDAADDGLRLRLQGEATADGQRVTVQPSTLRFDDGALQAEPLVLGLLQGQLALNGRYGLDDGAMALEALAEGLVWGEGEARVRASGKATLGGRVEAWTADLALALQRASQGATLSGRATGNAEAITLAPFALRTEGGVLEGEARYALDAAADFQLEATLHGLDPSWLAPGWPGLLDGRLRVDGAAPSDGALRYTASLDALRGTLRGQAIAGRARALADGERLDLELALSSGEGRLLASGALQPQLALDTRWQAFDVGPWADGVSGVLDGRFGLRGTLARPGIDADLRLRDVGIDDLRLAQLSLIATSPLDGDGAFALKGEGLVVPGLPPSPEGSGFDVRGRWQVGPGMTSGDLRLDAFDASLSRLPTMSLQAPGELAWSEAGWRLSAPLCLSLAREGRLCAEGDHRAINVRGEALELRWLGPFLPSDTDTPMRPRGRLTLDARWEGGAEGSTLALALRSPAGRLRVRGAAAEGFGWRNLVLDARHSSAGWKAAVGADLLPEGRLDARAEADASGALDGLLTVSATDLSLLEAFSADIAAPTGRLEGQLSLAGTTEAPRWQGRIALAPFSVDLPALGIAVEQGELHVDGADDGSLVLGGRLPTGDGALELAGRWAPGGARSTLSVRGTDVRVLDTPDGQAWISPQIDVELLDSLVSVRGRVDVPRASLQLDRFEQRVSGSADVVVVDDPVAAEATPALQLDADLRLALGDDVRLRGFGFDGRLSGELRLRDRVDREPRASGALTLSGEVRAYGQQLDLTRGALRWANAPIDEPVLDVLAERPDSDPAVGVALTGSALAPVVEVWSRPALPQAEALSWLMFGRPLASADGDDAAQLEQAATSLGGSAVAQAVAGKVGLDAASVGQSRALGGTAVTVGKRITPKLYVSYGMALSGTGQVITVTYALRRWLAAQFESGVEQRIELEATIDRD